MPTLVNSVLRTASKSRTYLDAKSRSDIIRFIRSRWNPDGGVRGRDDRSDIYYTVFAMISLRVLRAGFPYFKLWKYVRSFGKGDELDLIHSFCLIRLRSVFPMSGKTRRIFAAAVSTLNPESAYDMFFKVVTSEYLGGEHLPDAMVGYSPKDPTTNIAAAISVNRKGDPEAQKILLSRYCETGGFCVTEDVKVPDLLATATALYALRVMDYDLTDICKPCLEFVESLWRDSGGFAGHEADRYEDTEYTFYALMCIGCLME